MVALASVLSNPGDVVVGDLALGRHVGMVHAAQLPMAVREAPDAVAARVVAFDVPVGTADEGEHGRQRQEFDQAG